jgi:hypothetical protein
MPFKAIADAPPELADAVREFWPSEEWDNAVSIAFLESGWSAFATNDSVDESHPCGSSRGYVNGVRISAERSVGWFQVNTCNFPDWTWYHLFNTRHNAGTAHMLWDQRGWSPWYFSAKTLGLL